LTPLNTFLEMRLEMFIPLFRLSNIRVSLSLISFGMDSGLLHGDISLRHYLLRHPSYDFAFSSLSFSPPFFVDFFANRFSSRRPPYGVPGMNSLKHRRKSRPLAVRMSIASHLLCTPISYAPSNPNPSLPRVLSQAAAVFNSSLLLTACFGGRYDSDLPVFFPLPVEALPDLYPFQIWSRSVLSRSPPTLRVCETYLPAPVLIGVGKAAFFPNFLEVFLSIFLSR